MSSAMLLPFVLLHARQRLPRITLNPGYRSARSAMVHDLGWRTLRRQDGVHALWSASTSGRVRATIVYDWRLHRRTQLVSTSWSYLCVVPSRSCPTPLHLPFYSAFPAVCIIPSFVYSSSLASLSSPLTVLLVPSPSLPRFPPRSVPRTSAPCRAVRHCPPHITFPSVLSGTAWVVRPST